MKKIILTFLILFTMSNSFCQTKFQKKEALLVLNGKIISKEILDKINPKIIDSIKVLKDKSSTDKYGEKGKFGTIEIILKDNQNIVIVNDKYLMNDKILKVLSKKYISKVRILKNNLFTGHKKYETIILTTKKIKESELEELKKKYSLNSKTKPKELIKNKTIYLLGGIASIYTKEDIEFEKKYNIKYYDFGCIAPTNFEEFEVKNKKVFDSLSKEFGKNWQKEIKASSMGFSEWKKEKN